jgi:hypothetical protein
VGKYLIIFTFLFLLGGAIYTYVTKEESKGVRLHEPENTKRARIVLEDFTLYKYKNNRLKATLSAQLGSFLEPNLFDIYGNIRGLRHDADSKDFFVAESAIVYFKSRGIIELTRGAEIEKIELEKNVKVSSEDNTIKTEFARYLYDKELLESDLPVEFQTQDAKFLGENGFQYQVKSGDMVVNGPIRGEVDIEENHQ